MAKNSEVEAACEALEACASAIHASLSQRCGPCGWLGFQSFMG